MIERQHGSQATGTKSRATLASAEAGVPPPQDKPASSPIRTWIWGTFFRNKATEDFEPQPLEVTRQGELKVRRLEPRIELLACRQITAATLLVFTAKSALTDVKLVFVNTSTAATESAYTAYHCINGAAAATGNKLAAAFPVYKGARDVIEGLGMDAGDVIRASCTADNDFNCFIYGRRWIP